MTAIQEAKNLKTLSMDELLGSLKTHEKKLQREKEADTKSKKTLALKSIQHEDDDESMNGEGDMALLYIKCMKFLAKKKNSQGRHNNNPSSSRRNNDRSNQPRGENDEIKKCFHCHEWGLFKSNCPLRRKEKRDKKDKVFKHVKHTLKGTWSDSEGGESDADSSDEETTKLCLMTRDDAINSNYNSFSDNDDCDDKKGPPWLKPMLRANYFIPCPIHGDSNKSECNMYCLDCPSNALCSYCLIHHKDHRVVQVINPTLLRLLKFILGIDVLI